MCCFSLSLFFLTYVQLLDPEGLEVFQIWEVWLYSDSAQLLLSLCFGLSHAASSRALVIPSVVLSFLGFPFPASSILFFSVVIPFSPHGPGFSAFYT